MRFKVFAEKPDIADRTGVYGTRHFHWNAGHVFLETSVVMRCANSSRKTSTLLAQFAGNSPIGNSHRASGVFFAVRKHSIDYAVLEKAPNVFGLATDDFGGTIWAVGTRL